MTNAFSATPSADQPPTIANVRTAGQDYADRWDWLRIGAFFWGAVLLLNFAAWMILVIFWEPFNRDPMSPQSDPMSPQSYDLLTGWALAVAEVGLAALVLIVASVVRSRDFWGDQGPGRLRAALRLLGALGVLAAAGGFVLIFSQSITLAQYTTYGSGFLTGGWLQAGGIGWVLIGGANGCVLGVALAFVFRRLSRRTGHAWLAGLLGAALVAGCALGLSNELDTLLLRASLAATRALWPPPPTITHFHGISCHFWPDWNACDAFTGGQYSDVQVQAWLVAAVLPVLLALPLGALLGAPLAYPDRAARAARAAGTGPAQTTAPHGAASDASDANVPAGPRNAPDVAGRWPALGRLAGAFAAGVFVTAARLYAVLKLYYLQPTMGYLTNTLVLIGMLLLPFGGLALIGALRLLRMPRELRPPLWASAALALVVVLNLVPALSVSESLTLQGPLSPLAPPIPNALAYGGLGFAWAISLGAVLVVCWWPAARTRTRLATTALAGWLGFALPLVLLAGASAYQFATLDQTRYDLTTCYDLGCAAGKLATWAITGTIETALAAVLIGLPLTLFGAWMASWLLQRRRAERGRGRGAAA